MDKNAIADRIEKALGKLPDDIRASVELAELVAELRGGVTTQGSGQGGGNGNGPPTGP